MKIFYEYLWFPLCLYHTENTRILITAVKVEIAIKTSGFSDSVIDLVIIFASVTPSAASRIPCTIPYIITNKTDTTN